MGLTESEVEGFSASSTIISFDHPVSLLRVPVPASPSDDPSIGQFVLAFKDDLSWRSAFQATESKIIEQCQAGARIGCAISASAKCKPPWWKALFVAGTIDLAERERCEEYETSACLAESREQCVQFAKEKCLPAFRDARIAISDQKRIREHLFSTSPNSNRSPTSAACNEDSGTVATTTNYRGSVLLDAMIGRVDFKS